MSQYETSLLIGYNQILNKNIVEVSDIIITGTDNCNKRYAINALMNDTLKCWHIFSDMYIQRLTKVRRSTEQPVARGRTEQDNRKYNL
jgi:hypothetical protein